MRARTPEGRANQNERRIVSREPSWRKKKNQTDARGQQRALLSEIQDARASRIRKLNKNQQALRAGQETGDRKNDEELSRNNQHKDWHEDQIIHEDRGNNTKFRAAVEKKSWHLGDALSQVRASRSTGKHTAQPRVAAKSRRAGLVY
jgi:hypothetical protein